MSTQAVSMPSVQGEAMELFLRVSSPHVLSERPASRGSFTDNNAPRSSFGAQARPSTGVSRHGSSRVGVRAAEGLTGAKGFDAESITRSGLGMGKTAEGGTRVLRDSSVSNSKAQEVKFRLSLSRDLSTTSLTTITTVVPFGDCM